MKTSVKLKTTGRVLIEMVVSTADAAWTGMSDAPSSFAQCRRLGVLTDGCLAAVTSSTNPLLQLPRVLQQLHFDRASSNPQSTPWGRGWCAWAEALPDTVQEMNPVLLLLLTRRCIIRSSMHLLYHSAGVGADLTGVREGNWTCRLSHVAWYSLIWFYAEEALWLECDLDTIIPLTDSALTLVPTHSLISPTGALNLLCHC